MPDLAAAMRCGACSCSTAQTRPRAQHRVVTRSNMSSTAGLCAASRSTPAQAGLQAHLATMAVQVPGMRTASCAAVRASTQLMLRVLSRRSA